MKDTEEGNWVDEDNKGVAHHDYGNKLDKFEA